MDINSYKLRQHLIVPAGINPEVIAPHLCSDIVHTIRQVIGVVSKYVGGALPKPARGHVRGFILGLPRRFLLGRRLEFPVRAVAAAVRERARLPQARGAGCGGACIGGITGTG